jgi:hypothetical protein
MNRRILFLILAGISTFSVFSQNSRDFALRANVIDGVNGITIIGYYGKERDVVIPAMIDGLPVTSIGDQAFMLRNLINVVIPEGVLFIGRQAFFGNQLTTVNIPASVRVIGDSAFDNNQFVNIQKNSGRLNRGVVVESPPAPSRKTTVVQEVIVPAPGTTGWVKVIKKDSELLSASSAKTSPAPLPPPPPPPPAESVRSTLSYESAQAADTASRQSVTMNDNGTERNAASATPPPLSGYRSADGVEGKSLLVSPRDASAAVMNQLPPPLPNDGTFYLRNNGNGTAAVINHRGYYSSVTIPPQIGQLKITMIGNSAFMQHRLSEVDIPNTVTYIGDAAFSGNNLAHITLPESVRYIGFQAFAGNHLTSITIGANVAVQADSFRNQFSDYYRINGLQAGTYIWHDGVWSYTRLDDVRYHND